MSRTRKFLDLSFISGLQDLYLELLVGMLDALGYSG